MGSTSVLSNFAQGLEYQSVPKEVIHQAKRLILDTLACNVGGYRLHGGQTLVRVISQLGGQPEATVVPTGDMTSAPQAAFLNCHLSNLLDLDDNLLNHSHFACVVIPTAMVVGEREKASGKDVLAAVVAGYEVDSRITLSYRGIVRAISGPPNLQMEWVKVFGHGHYIMGAVTAAGKLLNLGQESMLDAWGIAGYSAPVPTVSKFFQCEQLPTSKYAAYGWMGWSAVTSALIAGAGITGDRAILDGEYGLWRMVGSDFCDWGLLTKDLGTKWWIMETSMKPYPTCTWHRQPVDAFRGIVRREGLAAGEIDAVIARVHPVYAGNRYFNLRQPRNYTESQLSLPYAIAMSAYGVPENQWHSEASMRDPEILSFSERVSTEVEPEWGVVYYEQVREEAEVKRARKSPATVVVRARGREFSETVEYAKGDPFGSDTALTDEELADKFRCHASGILDAASVETVIDQVLHLEDVPDVAALVPHLVATLNQPLA